MEALRRTDVEGVRATLAPDYDYDRSAAPAFDPANPFDSPLGLTYRSLYYRIEALTTVGKTATAIVTTFFDADLDLPLLGRTPVIGHSRMVLELEPRDGEWKLTAVRPVRVTYRNPLVPLPQGLVLLGPVVTLYDTTVNGRTSLTVRPGAPLALAGRSLYASLVIGVIGTFSLFDLKIVMLNAEYDEPWELELQAPDRPGCFLAYALSIVLVPDPRTGNFAFLAGDQVTIPVTVRE
jgi:hypothetical protein